MQTILAPTDFSDNAKNAVVYAAQLAKKLNASVVLLHAYMLPTPVSEVPYVMVNAEEMQKENERLAGETVEKLRATYGITATSIVRLGFPSEEIEAVIEDQPVDIIVMGMKGKGALEKMMGSTTTATITAAAETLETAAKSKDPATAAPPAAEPLLELCGLVTRVEG